MSDAPKRFNQLEIWLRNNRLEVYRNKDFGVSPSWVFGDAAEGIGSGYAQWLIPELGTKQRLIDNGLDEVRAMRVMRALAEGKEDHMTFDLSSLS